MHFNIYFPLLTENRRFSSVRAFVFVSVFVISSHLHKHIRPTDDSRSRSHYSRVHQASRHTTGLCVNVTSQNSRNLPTIFKIVFSPERRFMLCPFQCVSGCWTVVAVQKQTIRLTRACFGHVDDIIADGKNVPLTFPAFLMKRM